MKYSRDEYKNSETFDIMEFEIKDRQGYKEFYCAGLTIKADEEDLEIHKARMDFTPYGYTEPAPKYRTEFMYMLYTGFKTFLAHKDEVESFADVKYIEASTNGTFGKALRYFGFQYQGISPYHPSYELWVVDIIELENVVKDIDETRLENKYKEALARDI